MEKTSSKNKTSHSEFDLKGEAKVILSGKQLEIQCKPEETKPPLY